MTNPTFQVQPFVTVNAVVVGTIQVATLQSIIYNRELTGLNVVGPVGSQVKVYMNSVSPVNQIDSTSRGQSNTASYNPPFIVPAGSIVQVAWNLTDIVATCTFFLRGAS